MAKALFRTNPNTGEQEEVKRLQLNIPVELHHEFKLACVAGRIEMTDVVVELVKQWLEGRK